MKTAGGDPDHSVTDSNISAINDFVFVNNPDRKTGTIIIAAGVDSRHFSRFAAHQSAVALLKAFNDTFQQGLSLRELELSRGIVVEEEKRISSACDQIVDAH